MTLLRYQTPSVNKARVWHVQAHRSAGRGAGVHHGGAADDADVRAALGVLLGRGHHARRRQALLRPPRRQRRGAAHHRGDGARGEPWPEALGLWHGQLGFLMEAAFSAPYTSGCCPWHHQAAAVRKHSHTSQRHVQYESSCGGSSHGCMCCRDGAEGGCFVDDIRDQLNVKRAPGVGCRGRPRRTEWRAAAQPGGHYCESELLAAGTPLPLLHLPLTYSAAGAAASTLSTNPCLKSLKRVPGLHLLGCAQPQTTGCIGMARASHALG